MPFEGEGVALLREELIEYSVLQFIREGLSDYGFTLSGEGQNLLVREAFPTETERTEPLEMTTVAFGFNIDDGGKQAELGSTLTEYNHTLELWVFATEPRFGRRVAYAIKHIVRREFDQIPLRDYNQEKDPIIYSLQVMAAQVQHQANSSARPWDQFVWTCAVRVQDFDTP